MDRFDMVYPTEDGHEFFRKENIKYKQQLIELDPEQKRTLLMEKLKGNVGECLMVDILNDMDS